MQFTVARIAERAMRMTRDSGIASAVIGGYMLSFDFGKYRTIVISIALFLLLDLSVLVLNFVVSSEIKGDAVKVNLAGRQRMLSQRAAKVALQIEARRIAGLPVEAELKELRGAFKVFDETLLAFRSGGSTASGSGDPISIEAIDDIRAQAILAEAETLWAPYRSVIRKVVEAQSPSNAEVTEMARNAEASNLGLLKLMNDLTTRVEELAASKATMLRSIQLGGISLATINFLVILFHFIRHLHENDRALERARRETEDILRTTTEGMFLLDSERNIGSQHSHALADILGVDEPAGKNLLEILKPLVSDKTLATAAEYIDLLLNHDVKEKLVVSLNPLDRVEIADPSKGGQAQSRFLQFHFNRVMEAGKVTHLLVTANNITRRVRLEEELKASEKRATGQLGMLIEIMQVEPPVMQQYLRSACEGLETINRLLKEQSLSGEGMLQKVTNLYRIAHRLKGDGSALGLSGFSRGFHVLEDELDRLRAQESISGEDLLPVTVRMRQLFNEIEVIQDAVSRVSQIRGAVTIESPRPQTSPDAHDHPIVVRWHNFAAAVAKRQSKQVQFTYQGVQPAELPAKLLESVNTIVIQLIRNAVVHGIEAPKARTQHSKPEYGRLVLNLSRLNDDAFEVSFRDDGQGISAETLREAAVRSGRLSAEVAAAMDPRKVVALIFEPGFSTVDRADEDGGRGAGLDAVKDIVSRLGGQIRLGTTPGEYCHFRIALPAPRPGAQDEADVCAHGTQKAAA